jgi:excisionase family DNA binding protein
VRFLVRAFEFDFLLSTAPNLFAPPPTFTHVVSHYRASSKGVNIVNEVLDDCEVAAILDCDEKTVQEQARLGKLPAVKFGRSWRFPRLALLQVLNDMALGNAPEKPAPLAIKVPVKPKRRPPTLVSLTDLRP